MSDTVKVKVGMSIGHTRGGRYEEVVDTEIPQEKWGELTGQEQDAVVQDCIDTMVQNQLDTWGDVVPGAEQEA